MEYLDLALCIYIPMFMPMFHYKYAPFYCSKRYQMNVVMPLSHSLDKE